LCTADEIYEVASSQIGPKRMRDLDLT
jgi:hypothetical protein